MEPAEDEAPLQSDSLAAARLVAAFPKTPKFQFGSVWAVVSLPAGWTRPLKGDQQMPVVAQVAEGHELDGPCRSDRHSGFRNECLQDWIILSLGQ